MSKEGNKITARRVVQGNQEFLLAVVSVAQLRLYTRYTERIVTNFDEQGMPVYNEEVQRKTDTAKVNMIAQYLLNDPQAMFPTNMVLAVPDEVIIDYEEDGDNITVTLDPKVSEQVQLGSSGDVYISVIDGQHRLRGLEIAADILRRDIENTDLFLTDAQRESRKDKLTKFLNFQVAVSFFRGPVLEYQANIFSIINRTQTKVSEGLVYNLFGLSKTDSPQKTALEVSLALNGTPGSPFRNRIRLVGFKYTRDESPPLSQAAVVKSIVLCICPTIRKSEVERFMPRSAFRDGINSELCFRKYYARNEDEVIPKIMFAYFKAVQITFLDEASKSLWQSAVTDNILNTTVGYEAMLKVLKRILPLLSEQDFFNINAYQKFLQPAAGSIEFQNFSLYPKTSRSRKALYDDIIEIIIK